MLENTIVVLLLLFAGFLVVRPLKRIFSGRNNYRGCEFSGGCLTCAGQPGKPRGENCTENDRGQAD